MDNSIDHDSLHRVEPTAKKQNEDIAKADADSASLLKGQKDEHEVKENSPLESDQGNNVENDGSHEKNQNPQSEEKDKDKKKKKSQSRENFMGGQLFDADA